MRSESALCTPLDCKTTEVEVETNLELDIVNDILADLVQRLETSTLCGNPPKVLA